MPSIKDALKLPGCGRYYATPQFEDGDEPTAFVCLFLVYSMQLPPFNGL